MPYFEYENLNFDNGIILIRKFNGKLDVKDIIASWEYILSNKLLTNNHLGVINDLKGATLEMNFNCFDQLIDYLKKNPIFIKIKLAVICDSPDKIIYPTLGEYSVKDLHIRPFSTINAAIEWIKN